MPEPSYITGWRGALSAFRTPGRRLEAVTVTVTVAAAYLLCLAVAGAVALVANVLAVQPALKALFGWTPASAVAQLAEGAMEGTAVGGLVCFGIAWLARRNLDRVQRAIDSWFERSGT